MPSFAGRTGARAVWSAGGLLAVAMLVLAACGDNAAQTVVTDTDESGLAQGGVSTAAGASAPVGDFSVAGASGPLDTSTWILAPPFAAGGDEPFWRMEIVDGWFSFKRSGLRAIEEPLVQPRREGDTDVFETGSLKVEIARQPCETVGGGGGDFSVKVTFDQLDFDGCAFSGQAVATSPEATIVVESLAQIDACLARLGEPALATAVYPRQDGEQVAVSLRAKTGAFYECVTDGGGANVVSLDPLDSSSQPSWMNRMRFQREGNGAKAACADAEDVRAGDQVVGRLLGKACKF